MALKIEDYGLIGNLRAVAGAPEELQIMYDIHGRRLKEFDLDWLPGYEGSKPVRMRS